MFFFKNHGENDPGRLVPYLPPPFVFWNSFLWSKIKWWAVSVSLGSPQLGHTVKTNYGTSDCSAIDILSFDFSEKGPRLVSLTQLYNQVFKSFEFQLLIYWYFSMIFHLFVKMFMIAKNSIVETQNLVMNHKSQPIKSNPIVYYFLDWFCK